MFNLSDTITAITTPLGVGGIAAIRISGNDSWSIVKKIFYRKDGYVLEHMKALHCYIKDKDKKIDEVVILPFKGPKSFTAEDSVEIFCHGGNKIVSMIMDLCLKNGARRASSGEFTFRAFINGRIDLTEAEAINEIINASNSRSVYAASEVLMGSLKSKVKTFREKLLDLITSIESSIEFPMDVNHPEKSQITRGLNEVSNELEKLIKNSENGQLLNSGIKVSIIGPPNVGKSSLLNQLLENNRSIVTSEPGTTRDTVEEKLILDGYPFVLIDTAGIRDSECLGEAEKSGIERSKFALNNSDISLFVFDLTKKTNQETSEILGLANEKNKIVIGNKLDLLEPDGALPEKKLNCDIAVSAKFGTNIDKLKNKLIEKAKSVNRNHIKEEGIYINQRQKELLLQCKSSLDFAIEVVAKNDPDDLIADELKKAISKLDEVSGRLINDDVISSIFAKFCIGK